MPNQYFGKVSQRLQYLKEAISAETDDCIIWPFSRHPQGYGTIWFEGKPWLVNRVVMKLTDPNFKFELDCLHKCDNPPCFNKRHLFQGTHQDNMDDRGKKNRCSKLKTNTKLNPAQIREIRNSSLTQTVLARRYGVSQAAIWYVLKGRTWSDVI